MSHREVIEKASTLVQTCHKIKNVHGFYDDTCRKWEENCLEIPTLLNTGLIKIGVAGAVKSGKSTFINSMFNKDFLKRGAGVVTSVVTRIQRKKKLKAKILLKSWGEINKEIKELLFNINDDYFRHDLDFNLQNKKDRDYLKKISKANKEMPESILFDNILENYAFYKNNIKSKEVLLQLKNNKFADHTIYTGDPSKAFFIKDVKLDIDFGGFDNDIEIADCQGIDSIDIIQLSRVLKYLETANLIIYIISSRTGVREADIKFLSILIRMGLGDNLIFVLNCDLSEHDCLEDLKEIRKNLKHDLQHYLPDLNLYSLSSFYNLFYQDDSKFSQKDAKIVQAWESDHKTIQYLKKETERFDIDFNHKINNDRQNLIIANPLKRINFIARGLLKKIDLYQGIFSDNKAVADNAVKELMEIQQYIGTIQKFFASSSKTIYTDLKNILDSKIDNYFILDDNSVINEMDKFIENYIAGTKQLKDRISTKDLPKTLYLLSRDLKNKFNKFFIENVSPDFVKFIQKLEDELDSQAISLYSTYNIKISNLHNKLGKMFFDKLGIADLYSIKQRLDVKPPPAAITIRYNARIKIDSFAGFGMHSILRFVLKKLDKDVDFGKSFMFNKACIRLKNEILKSIKIQVLDLKQKIKQKYFYILIDFLSKEIEETIIDQFKMYSIEIDKIKQKLNQEKSEKGKQRKLLNQIAKDVKAIL